MESNLQGCASFQSEICVLFSEKTMTEFVANIFLSPLENTGEDFEHELLHLNILREASEMYFMNASKNSCVCENIANLSNIFLNEDSWNNMIAYLQRKTDKYLVFATSRTISAIMYNFSLPIFEQRLLFLIESILKATENTTLNNLFEVLTSLLDYHIKITYNANGCRCENVVARTVSSPRDIFSCLCISLSSYWNSFVDTFLGSENPNINFLHLWNILSEKNFSENLSSVFLNEDLAVNFLSIAFNLPPIALRLYVDIIAQIFCSSLKSGSWKCSQKESLEVTLMSAVSGKCLDLLPLSEMSLTFCSPINRDKRMSQLISKINITSKKIIFVIFNLLTEFTNTASMCKVLDKMFEFISTHIDTWKPRSINCWIVDSFIEYDDLLFGVMFATLKIYCKLKDQDPRPQECNASADSFVEEFNPHKTFIKFLQQIGWDHNELLSFLLSDETCCLVYLIWYLKLLLAEWTQFVEAHEFHFFEKYEQDLLLKHIPLNSHKSIENASGHNRKLVSYSSSSNSDDEDSGQLNPVDKKNEIGDYLKERTSKTISILINLKEGIQKLVDVKEFPYNVQPLIKLLKMCSDKCVLLT